MHRHIALCCLLLWCVSVSMQCYLPNYNLKIVTLKDDDGEWYDKVTLDHQRDEPLEIYTSRTSHGNRCSDHIVIAYKKNDSVIEEERLKALAERKEESTSETCSCPTTGDSNVEEHKNGSGRVTVHKEDNELIEITEVPVKKSVPSGYNMLFDEKSYVKVNAETKSWHEAKNLCESDGGHLLILDSIDEANSVSYWVQLTGNINKYFWIGFHDLYEEGKHVTLFNQSVTNLYNIWWAGYKKGVPNYDCGLAYFAANEKHGLVEWGCSNPYPYICEIEV